jgi:PAT family beta-lactamase induction signal transducer AmpG
VSYFGFVMVATIPSFLATWFAPFHHDDGSALDETAAPGSDTAASSQPAA